VLCPLGDFFGLGHGIVNSYQSLLFTASTIRNNQFDQGCALNSYAPMPFRKRAVVELVNESDGDHGQYFYIDYERRPRAGLDGTGYFHAEFRRACPFLGWGPEMTVNTPPVNIPNLAREAWANNYVILETKGRGHYLGCNISDTNIQGTWWGEGDDMIWVDGYKWPPDLHGTGSEDYLNQAWGMQPNAFLRNGSSIHEMNTGGYQTSYVHHIENPVRSRSRSRSPSSTATPTTSATRWPVSPTGTPISPRPRSRPRRSRSAGPCRKRMASGSFRTRCAGRATM